MTTPIPSAVYPRAVLALTMGLSTWLNTTHAAVAYPGQSWRWAILGMAAIPPLAVPVLIELVGREARRGGATAAFRGAMCAAVLLTLIAFAVSVWAITSLGMQWGMPLVVAAAFPLVLDLGAAVATLFLLDRAAAEARVAGRDAARIMSSAARHDDADRAVHDLVYPSTLVPLTAPGPRRAPGQESDHAAASAPVTSSDAMARHSAVEGDDTVTAPLTLPDTPDRDATVTRREVAATRVTGDSVPDHAPGLTRTAEISRVRRLASVPLVATDDTNADNAELILRLIAEGATGTRVAAELGVSKSTALRRIREVRRAAGTASAQPPL
ncbi:hypothetical protein [Tsukamurella tyrosinosolvens]|uniref:hypothetical protein n=1 Tax=Tsukamurella tyrosinosolvens TaxID=57704 RepID=UPI002DD43250|nr:hypothetical protein [Tsukamurella tyrosinosolvens]MEC4615505.1 hypothetical protein [Tsukamurella tyrosinosolvens]